MTILNKEDIRNILIGATLMASGGGGPLETALNMLDTCENRTVCLYTADELSKEEDIAVIAAMGEPEAIKNQDFGLLLYNTYKYLKQQSQAIGKNIVGCIPVEYGGFNTFAPIYLALKYPDIKLVDADGCGRAVPGLDTTYLSLNNCSITPMVLANEENDVIYINSNGNITTSFMEDICRKACTEPVFNSISGLGAWIMKKEQIKNKALCGNLMKAKKIGECIKSYNFITQKYEFFSYLQEQLGQELYPSGIFAKSLGYNKGFRQCIIEDVRDLQQVDGFNGAEIQITEYTVIGKKTWLIHYLNESLVLYEEGNAVMTAPDIIAIFDEATGLPLSNDYIHKNKVELKGRKISLGAIRIDQKWNNFSEIMNQIWKKYFHYIHYDKDCISIDTLLTENSKAE